MATYRKTQPPIFSIILLCLTTVAAQAADATFSWTANSEPVSGYKIHYGTSSHNYNLVIDVGLPAAVNGNIIKTVQGLQEGNTYYFAATAYSATEVSDYSAEVAYTVPGGTTTPPLPPIAGDISLQGNEDMVLIGQLNADSSEGSNLTFTVASQPGHGSVTVDKDTGSFTYTPALNYSGDDSFSYTADNSGGTSKAATVAIHLNPANDPPVADNTSIFINENTSYSGQLSASDVEDSNLFYSLVEQAGKGTVSITPDGSFSYIPQPNFYGTDSFTFTVSDGRIASNTAQVDITIQHVNIAPVVQNNSFSVDQGTPYSGQLIATDANGDIVHFSITTAPAKGTLLLADNGAFTYTPNGDASGADLFTFLATDGTAASNSGTLTILINKTTNDLAFELGELLVTSDWQHVDFSNEYTSPAVIAKLNTMNDAEAGIVSIRKLTSKGFDIRIRNWDYVGGFHAEETVSFMAMERGRHQIADKVYAAAECTNLSGLNTFKQIKFANSFTGQPVVLASIVTENEANAAILRIKKITSNSSYITMQEQEKNDRKHAEETICYIAMEKWSGVVDGLMVEAGTTEKILTDKTSTVSFKQQFPTIPFILADMQSANGMDTAIIGMSDLSVTDTGMTIMEEQSANRETRHVAEIGGYIAVTPYNP
ncbi:tandem-95 repeat protein [Desulfopila sp. IMCC35006]|uniref:Ig-like domain-containing protein n=1 Tax=Desulfopila sp. IMCC35006 TaxID=2569542 RepID=UPI0010AB9D66|nr:Ig-like domain-containing protein [Desulfopila sp. IMCC35006]TKB23224.1 tandem-95 repeat protein [Desulfopila sp. IMCC35006]